MQTSLLTSPPCQPVHRVTGLASALGEATLPFGRGEECHTSGYLRVNGGGRRFPGKRTGGEMMSFVDNIHCGLWLVLQVGRAFAGPEERKKGKGTTCAHTRVCVCTHTIWVIFVLYSGL